MKRIKKRKASRATKAHIDDKSFLIIVGGGFLVIVFALFFINRSSRFFSMPSAANRMMGKNVVVIKDYSFEPETIRVSSGDTVSWTNQDSVSHTISATNNSFTTGVIYQGGEGSYTFTAPGEYNYYSTLYPNVRGKVVVE